MAPANPSETWVGGVRFALDSSRYKVLGLLGQGSFGTVAAGIDRNTGKKLAIKHISPVAGDRSDARHILREVVIMRLLRYHPNVSRKSHARGECKRRCVPRLHRTLLFNFSLCRKVVWSSCYPSVLRCFLSQYWSCVLRLIASSSGSAQFAALTSQHISTSSQSQITLAAGATCFLFECSDFLIHRETRTSISLGTVNMQL